MSVSETSVVAPASYGQERIWLAAQLAPEATYHVWGWIPVARQLDEGLLRRALAMLTHRHEALRTRLELRDGDLRQVVLKRVDPEIVERTTTDLTREDVMLGRGAPDGGLPTEPFDVERAPLWRVAWVHCVDGDLLLVLAHHAVFDAASHGIVARELTALFADPDAELAPVGLQPADVATWQRDQAAAGALAEGLDYWRGQLHGAPGVHGLPLDGDRSDISGQPGADVFFRLPPGTSQQAESFARSVRATEFMVSLAACAAFLHRVSGDEEIVFGVPVSDRDVTGTEDTIGMFVNTVVLRVRLGDDPTFHELVQRCRDLLLGAWDHAAVPLQLFAERVPYERVPGTQPLYQLGFNHLGRTGLGRAFGHAKDELFFELSEDDGRLEFRTDLFESETAERLAQGYGRTFAGLVAAPDQRISDLALDARGTLPFEVGPATPEPPLVTEAIDRLGECADRPAVTFGEETMTYAELDRWSAGVAGELARRGVVRGDAVAVSSTRSLGLVPSVIGVLRAGGAYVPIDPDLPEERRGVMRELSGAAVLLDDDLQSRRHDLEPADAGQVRVQPGDAAYVLFTSGSTGEPKGVINTHGGLAHRLAWMQDTYRIGPEDVVLQKTPTTFDVSVWEIVWPLLHGARLVVAEPDAHRDPASIARLAAREGVTVLHFVPSMLRAFLATDAQLPRSVRHVVCSGETLSSDVVRDLQRTHPWIAVDNLYGPTEAAIDVSWHRCEATDSRSVPLGRPVAGTTLRVLDERLRRQPVGVAGQLFIAGPQLARGYAARPGLTAARFVPDPYGPPGSVMYATGDRARWRPDGTLAHLGRSDGQVKVRGQRIEVEEVASAARAVDGVRDAVVLASPDAAGDTTLTAFVTGTATSDAVRHGLRRRLPEGFVPTGIRVLSEIPVTRHGKVDRAALLNHPAEPRPAATSTRPPSATEQLVGIVLGEALGRPPLRPEENFFTRGGHSLAAIRALTALRQRTGTELPVSSLFTHPTPADLAELLPEGASVDAGQVAPRFAPRTTTRVADLDDEDVERMLRTALADRSARKVNR